MPKRKTIEVEKIRQMVNRYLAKDTNPTEGKQALCTLLSIVLFDTGNYKGFGYVDWNRGGCSRWNDAGQPDEQAPFLGPEYKREYY